LGGRLRAFRILRAASGADGEGHGHVPLLPMRRIVLVWLPFAKRHMVAPDTFD
jgi:hypothetical protein